MKFKISNKSNQHLKNWGGNCTALTLIESKDWSIKKEIMPPNTFEIQHFHKKAKQFFYILEGKATFEIDEQKIIIHQNEGIEIFPNCIHQIKNNTNTNLIFIVISSPSTNFDRHEIFLDSKNNHLA